jgi:hypothetical protein
MMSKPGLPARVTEAADELDQRFHIAAGLRRQINKVFPNHLSFMLGEIALYSFIVLLLSGTYRRAGDRAAFSRAGTLSTAITWLAPIRHAEAIAN